jgi:DNA replication protein DnaC
MLTETTLRKLDEMKLGTMARTYRAQMGNNKSHELSFDERFGLIADAEWTARKNNRLTRLIRNANYDIPSACVEDIEYHADRKLNKDMINRLASCNYIDNRHNVVILGATGNGKTYLANALGMTASRMFYTVKYIRLPELLGELAIAREEGRHAKIFKQYKQTKLLIIDEWLLFPLTTADTIEVLELVNARHKRASTIFCSQFPVDAWHDKIGEPAVADAICDRIVHDSYNIVLHGDGMRKRKGLKEA